MKKCSSNPACGCFHATDGNVFCDFIDVACSKFVSCLSDNRTCFQPNTVCVQHPRCHARPVCYPRQITQICPPLSTMTTPSICSQAKWSSNGITVAGGNGLGDDLNQLQFPVSIVIDHDDGSIYISDEYNSRVMKWVPGAKSSIVVAGGNGRGNESNMLNTASQILLDKKDGSLLICDQVNQRVQRWQKNSNNGETILSNIPCVGLAMDSEGSFYATEWDSHRITKWFLNDTKGQIIAGGNGPGSGLDQFDHPSYLFIDQDQTLFIADQWNNRIIKWLKNAKQGIVVAGGNDEGSNMNQLIFPTSVIVDQIGTLYITDTNNNRLQRWFKDAISASATIAGGRDEGPESNQLSFPYDVAFDRHGNLFVVDHYNHRVQMFQIDTSDC
ncbi:unnamed protein product [Rotaria sp. Silwood1]|nr:unnamed protein product [Rotaria sp. Silwood1]CAF1609193.1 unnamed protein product [Rotaria sp. Silwood1]